MRRALSTARVRTASARAASPVVGTGAGAPAAYGSARVPLVVVVAVGAGACRGGETATTTGTSSAGRIVVDRSIGPVSIGLARQRVVRLLGRPDSTLAVGSRPAIASTARARGTLARYRSHGGALLIVYDSRGRVASME